MYTHIMIPVDLAVKDTLTRALEAGCDLAAHWGARITLVSVSGGLSAVVSHSEKEYERQLGVFAREWSERTGTQVDSHNITAPDPSVDVDSRLRRAIDDLEVDLVVMASHMPGWSDYIVSSHGGRLAAHAPISVMVVRSGKGA